MRLEESEVDYNVPHTRQIFYVGGHYCSHDETQAHNGAKIRVEQIYVERLTPPQITQKYPIVLWHGMGTTGACWLTTPDGRPGWASYFLTKGYVVYIPDIAQRGRSAWQPNSSELISVPHTYAENYWTATQNMSHRWPQASKLTQWPGTGRLGDQVFDNFMAGLVQARKDYRTVEALARESGTELLRKIGPSVLLTHSQGGAHGWVIADSVPELVRAIVAVEPVGPPFYNDVISVVQKTGPEHLLRPYGITITPIHYDSQLSDNPELEIESLEARNSSSCTIYLQNLKQPAKQLTQLASIPILIVTSEAGYHARTDLATVEYMRQAGANVDWLDLPEGGVFGNGHFMFMEMNNMVIVERIDRWLHSKIS